MSQSIEPLMQTALHRRRGREGLWIHAMAHDAGGVGSAGLRAAAARKARADDAEEQKIDVYEVQIDVDSAPTIEQGADDDVSAARKLWEEHVVREVLDAVGAERVGRFVEQRSGRFGAAEARSRGDDGSDSDVDVAVLWRKEEPHAMGVEVHIARSGASAAPIDQENRDRGVREPVDRLLFFAVVEVGVSEGGESIDGPCSRAKSSL